MTLTGHLIREARILAGLSQADLAAAADVALGLIVRIEATNGMVIAKKTDLGAIRRVLKAAGVEFTGGGQPYVRLRKPEPDSGTER